VPARQRQQQADRQQHQDQAGIETAVAQPLGKNIGFRHGVSVAVTPIRAQTLTIVPRPCDHGYAQCL
jgi:hypothetical protein